MVLDQMDSQKLFPTDGGKLWSNLYDHHKTDGFLSIICYYDLL